MLKEKKEKTTLTRAERLALETEWEDLAMRGTPWDGTAEGRKVIEETWKQNEARMAEIETLLEGYGPLLDADEDEEPCCGADTNDCAVCRRGIYCACNGRDCGYCHPETGR